MRKTVLLLSVLLSASVLPAGESHVDEVVGSVLANVAKLKEVDSNVVAMAFWDFDGTILHGDISTGLTENGREVFRGLVCKGILAGYSKIYAGEAGWAQFQVDYARLNEIGHFIAWPYNAQLFAGADAAALDAFCRKQCREVYRHWYFKSSLEILSRLEAAGVENYVISGSPEVFVRAAAQTINLPASRINGVRVGIDGGRFSDRIDYPTPFEQGKIDILRRIVNTRGHAYAVAAFGDSYTNDGPFMHYVATQRLPAGAKGTSMFINGDAAKRPAEYNGLFREVRQSEVVKDGKDKD